MFDIFFICLRRVSVNGIEQGRDFAVLTPQSSLAAHGGGAAGKKRSLRTQLVVASRYDL